MITPATTTTAPRLALGGMLALAAAMGIGRFVYTPILPAMVQALGLSKTEAGLIAAANFLGYLLGALLTALPRLPGGRRAWLMAALLGSAAFMLAMAAAGSMPVFLALRLLGGVASAFVLVLGSALVLDRLAAMGRPGLAWLHFAGVGAGIATSAVLVDVLQFADAGWRVLWLASGLLSAMALPVVARLVPGEAAAVAPAPASGRRPAGLGVLSACHGLFGFGYVVTATFIVAEVRIAPNAGVLEQTVWIVVGLAAIPSTAIWGWAGRRWGVFNAYGLACVVEALGVAVCGVWPGAVGTLLGAALLGGTFMGITALGFVAARALAPAWQRGAFAALTAAFGAGQVLGPVVAGWLLDRTHSFLLPSLVATLALLLGAALTRWLSLSPIATR